MQLSLKSPSVREFDEICKFIQAFELDNRGLKKEEFIVALCNGEIVGFGRLRHHSDCVELCSLGVVEPQRLKGVGSAVVNELVKHAPSQLFLVCIIPDFFSPFGFELTNEYPPSIKNKMHYCTSELVVPETYVAMVLNK